MNYKELYQPAHTIIGKGCIQEIPRYIDTIAGNKALVVTDEGLYKIGTVKKVTDVLDRAGKPYALYTGVKPNPTVSLVNEAKAVYDRGMRLPDRNRRRFPAGCIQSNQYPSKKRR